MMTKFYANTVIFNVDVREPLQVLDIRVSPQGIAPKDGPKRHFLEYLSADESPKRLAVVSVVPDVQAVVSWEDDWSVPDVDDRGERREREVYTLEGAVHIATGIPVRVHRSFLISPERLPVYAPPPEWPRDKALKPAVLTPDHVPLLEDVVSILRAGHARRFEVAMLEYASALHADDIRREFIHGVIALEALFGDSETEATTFKVAVRASLCLPSFKGRAREGFELVRMLYGIRSKFVHGNWDMTTLRRAREYTGRLQEIVQEALQECVEWVKSGRSWEPGVIDDEFLFRQRTEPSSH